MPDLDESQSSQTVKIIGSDATGLETNFGKISSNQDQGVSDTLDNGGVHGSLTVGTSAVAARVGGSNLPNRKSLTVTNISNTDIYWGYDNTVTTSTGTPIYKNQFAAWKTGPNTTVYLIAGSASNEVRVTEGA